MAEIRRRIRRIRRKLTADQRERHRRIREEVEGDMSALQARGRAAIEAHDRLRDALAVLRDARIEQGLSLYIGGDRQRAKDLYRKYLKENIQRRSDRAKKWRIFRRQVQSLPDKSSGAGAE